MNVYLYGVVWRNTYVKGLRGDSKPTKDAKHGSCVGFLTCAEMADVELGEQKIDTKVVG